MFRVLKDLLDKFMWLLKGVSFPFSRKRNTCSHMPVFSYECGRLIFMQVNYDENCFEQLFNFIL